MSIETWCSQLLLDSDNFRVALLQYVDGKSTDKVGEQGIMGMLLMIDFALDMLRDAGLFAQHKVYTVLKHKTEPTLEMAHGVHMCAFSALMSLKCVRVDEQTTVHEHYRRWMLSVWLITHMHELEQKRRRASACAEIPPADVELYRSAFVFVLEQLDVLYASVLAAQGRQLGHYKKKPTTQSV